MADDQLRVGEQSAHDGGQPVSFLTDDELNRRLSQVENGLRHFEAIIPAMIREVSALRSMVNRGVTADEPA